MKERIRPIYEELKGYLSQTPPTEEMPCIFDSSIWNQYNNVIKELKMISSKNYNRFLIEPKDPGDGIISINNADYRNKLGGVIQRLYGEYFSDEQPPFSGAPTTIISQNQQQTQSTQVEIQILLKIQDEINEKISKFKKDNPKRKFLEKIKKSLSSIKNITEFIALILKTAKDFNLNIEQILDIFK